MFRINGTPIYRDSTIEARYFPMSPMPTGVQHVYNTIRGHQQEQPRIIANKSARVIIYIFAATTDVLESLLRLPLYLLNVIIKTSFVVLSCFVCHKAKVEFFQSIHELYLELSALIKLFDRKYNAAHVVDFKNVLLKNHPQYLQKKHPTNISSATHSQLNVFETIRFLIDHSRPYNSLNNMCNNLAVALIGRVLFLKDTIEGVIRLALKIVEITYALLFVVGTCGYYKARVQLLDTLSSTASSLRFTALALLGILAGKATFNLYKHILDKAHQHEVNTDIVEKSMNVLRPLLETCKNKCVQLNISHPDIPIAESRIKNFTIEYSAKFYFKDSIEYHPTADELLQSIKAPLDQVHSLIKILQNCHAYYTKSEKVEKQIKLHLTWCDVVKKIKFQLIWTDDFMGNILKIANKHINDYTKNFADRSNTIETLQLSLNQLYQKFYEARYACSDLFDHLNRMQRQVVNIKQNTTFTEAINAIIMDLIETLRSYFSNYTISFLKQYAIQYDHLLNELDDQVRVFCLNQEKFQIRIKDIQSILQKYNLNKNNYFCSLDQQLNSLLEQDHRIEFSNSSVDLIVVTINTILDSIDARIFSEMKFVLQSIEIEKIKISFKQTTLPILTQLISCSYNTTNGNNLYFQLVTINKNYKNFVVLTKKVEDRFLSFKKILIKLNRLTSKIKQYYPKNIAKVFFFKDLKDIKLCYKSLSTQFLELVKNYDQINAAFVNRIDQLLKKLEKPLTACKAINSYMETLIKVAERTAVMEDAKKCSAKHIKLETLPLLQLEFFEFSLKIFEKNVSTACLNDPAILDAEYFFIMADFCNMPKVLSESIPDVCMIQFSKKYENLMGLLQGLKHATMILSSEGLLKIDDVAPDLMAVDVALVTFLQMPEDELVTFAEDEFLGPSVLKEIISYTLTLYEKMIHSELFYFFPKEHQELILNCPHCHTDGEIVFFSMLTIFQISSQLYFCQSDEEPKYQMQLNIIQEHLNRPLDQNLDKKLLSILALSLNSTTFPLLKEFNQGAKLKAFSDKKQMIS